jgi:hypothetical protein
MHAVDQTAGDANSDAARETPARRSSESGRDKRQQKMNTHHAPEC